MENIRKPNPYALGVLAITSSADAHFNMAAFIAPLNNQFNAELAWRYTEQNIGGRYRFAVQHGWGKTVYVDMPACDLAQVRPNRWGEHQSGSVWLIEVNGIMLEWQLAQAQVRDLFGLKQPPAAEPTPQPVPVERADLVRAVRALCTLGGVIHEGLLASFIASVKEG